MKNYIITSLCLFLITSVSYSQKRMGKENRNKIKSLKIAYITEELNLTEKEAQKFWPIYNAHEETIESLRTSERSMIRKLSLSKDGFESLTKKESDDMLLMLIANEKEIFEANQKFRKKLMKILPSKKILKLEYAERGFKRKMFDRLRRMKSRNNRD